MKEFMNERTLTSIKNRRIKSIKRYAEMVEEKIKVKVKDIDFALNDRGNYFHMDIEYKGFVFRTQCDFDSGKSMPANNYPYGVKVSSSEDCFEQERDVAEELSVKLRKFTF